MRTMLAAIAIFVGWPLGLAAQPTGTPMMSGMTLFQACEFTDSPALQGVCSSYIAGVASGVAVGMYYSQHNITYCPPANVTGEQLMLVVEKYLRDHPEQLNYDASLIIGQALHVNFPCLGK